MKVHMEYTPKPMDTGDIQLSETILEIAEILSKNTHEVWAKNKMKEGYIYGDVTDDTLKTHNCLVPYEHLSEAEKAYDLDTSIETIKLLIKLGFDIERGISNNVS
jgi:ryanodine receptor 2